MKYIFLPLLLLSITLHAQILDFENMGSMLPGDTIRKMNFENTDCTVSFYSGFNLTNTQPMTLQRIAHYSGNGGFIGVRSSLDCTGKNIRPTQMNQVNEKKYVKNPSITNRERIGCHFISSFLKGDSIASIFIEYETGTLSCSGDLLDVDGDENSIEAYDIYYYANTEDYPSKPINEIPIEIRTVGRLFGAGIIGDNGGVLPFKIESKTMFKLIELRPLTRVDEKNAQRTVYGFALDNFSPCEVENMVSFEKEDVQEIALQETSPVFKDFQPLTLYFDFDSYTLSSQGKKELNSFIKDLKSNANYTLKISGFTDEKGTEAYNIQLANNRINTVKKYLIKNGIPPSKIRVKIWGETYLDDKGKQDQKRRRAIIDFYPSE